MPRWPAGGLAVVLAAVLLVALAIGIGISLGSAAAPPRVDAGGIG